MNCAEQSTAEEIENGSMPMGSGAQTWRPGNAPRWMAVAGEGHGFYNDDNSIAFYRALEAFLREHIGS